MNDEQYRKLLEGQTLDILRIAISALDDAYLRRNQKEALKDALAADPECNAAKITSLSLYNRLRVTPGADTRTALISTRVAKPKAMAVLMLLRREFGASITFNQEEGIDYYVEKTGKGTAKYRLGKKTGEDSLPLLFRFHYWRDAPRNNSGHISTGLLRLSQDFDKAASLILTYQSADVPEERTRKLFEGTWENRDKMITVSMVYQSESVPVGMVILYFRVAPTEKLAEDDFYCSYIKSHSSRSFPGYPTAGIGFLQHLSGETDWKEDEKEVTPPAVKLRLIQKRLLIPDVPKDRDASPDIEEEILRQLDGNYTGYLIHARNELVRFGLTLDHAGSALLTTHRTETHNFIGYQGTVRISGRPDYPNHFLVIDSDSGNHVFPIRFIFRIEKVDDAGESSWKIGIGIRTTMDYDRPVIGMAWVTKLAANAEALKNENIPFFDAGSPSEPGKRILDIFNQDPSLAAAFLNERNTFVFNDLIPIQRLFPTSGISDLLPHDPLHHLIRDGISQLFSCYYLTYPQEKSMEKATIQEVVANRIPFRIWKNGLAEVTYESGTFRGVAMYRDSSLFLVFTDTIRVQVLLSVPKPKRIDDRQQKVERFNGVFSTVVDDYNRVESRSCVFITEEDKDDERKPGWVNLDSNDVQFWDSATNGVISHLQGPMMRGFRAAQSNSGNIPLPRNEEIKNVYFNSARYLLSIADPLQENIKKRQEIIGQLNQAYLHGFGRNTFRGKTIDHLLNTVLEEKLTRALTRLRNEQEQVKALFEELSGHSSPVKQDIAQEVREIWKNELPAFFKSN